MAEVVMLDHIDDLREYRAGYAHALESTAAELAEALALALRGKVDTGSP